jgi:predicted phosphodiesterase
MRLHILSDLYCEFSDYHIRVFDADVIVLAGDIATGTRGVMWAKELLSETSSKIIYVMGKRYNKDCTKAAQEFLGSKE